MSAVLKPETYLQNFLLSRCQFFQYFSDMIFKQFFRSNLMRHDCFRVLNEISENAVIIAVSD